MSWMLDLDRCPGMCDGTKHVDRLVCLECWWLLDKSLRGRIVRAVGVCDAVELDSARADAKGVFKRMKDQQELVRGNAHRRMKRAHARAKAKKLEAEQLASYAQKYLEV